MRRSIAPLLALTLPHAARRARRRQGVARGEVRRADRDGHARRHGDPRRDHGHDADRGGINPVVGSPIYLKLTGRYGDTTRAAAAGDRTPGHYTVRIADPGRRRARGEIGIHGTSDLPMMIMNDPFTFGAITARTAQLAPPLATPDGRATRGVGRRPGGGSRRDTRPRRRRCRWPASSRLLAIVGLAALGVALVARRRHVAGPTPRSA